MFPLNNNTVYIDANGNRHVLGDILGGSGSGAVEAIAPIEETETSTRAYSKGDQFFFEGELVTATADISIDDTITVGESGNAIPSDTIVDQLDAVSGWTDITADCTFGYTPTSGSKILYNAKLKLVFFTMQFLTGVSNVATLVTLPTYCKSKFDGICGISCAESSGNYVLAVVSENVISSEFMRGAIVIYQPAFIGFVAVK